MVENKFERVAEDDPNRCQAVDSHGQCIYGAVEGGTNCPRHGGGNQIRSQAAAGLKNYRLTKWQAQADQKVSSTGLKSLRDEIAILRMVLEERLNRCNDAQELMMMSGPISELVMKIEKIVTSCNKLERSMSLLLDKQALLQFASEVVKIITEELSVIKDSEPIIANIADRIINALHTDEET